jgi:hypothetical protein
MKSTLYKWTNGKWKINPTDGVAYSGEIIYAKGNECIEASAGENACRIILFYEVKNKKAALLHTNDMNGEEYETLINAIKGKKFNISNTKVFLCGDEGEEGYKSWNDDIECYLKNIGHKKVCRITKGKEKNVKINLSQNRLTITDSSGNDLLGENNCNI